MPWTRLINYKISIPSIISPISCKIPRRCPGTHYKEGVLLERAQKNQEGNVTKGRGLKKIGLGTVIFFVFISVPVYAVRYFSAVLNASAFWNKIK